MLATPGIRCRRCTEIDWFHDGYRVRESPRGEVIQWRAAPTDPEGAVHEWSCIRCGAWADRRSDLARLLTSIRRAQDD